MIRTTERLELIVLNPTQLRLWAEDTSALERELSVHYRAESLTGIFLQIVRGQVEKTEQNADRYPWHSFWLLVRKEDRVVVGSADFKYPPDENGETEIGYGLGRAFEHCGYMTEAVGDMCAWAFEQDGVSAVIAETERNNPASGRVLTRCGFRQYREAENLWWRLLR